MAQTMHYDLPQERLHPAINTMDLELSQRASQRPADDETQPFQLEITNSLWGQVNHPFLQSYLDTLAKNYGAGIRLFDFDNSPEPARLEINRWVEEQTRQKIKDFVPAGAIDKKTCLVLANAIYFKSNWLFPFAEISTRPMPFYMLDASQVQLPMMFYPQASLKYTDDSGYRAVEIPYAGDQVSMLVVVPDSRTFTKFENKLGIELVETIIANLEARTVALSIPKFSFASNFDLEQVLVGTGMGMPDAFDDKRADFSGVDGERYLKLKDVFH